VPFEVSTQRGNGGSVVLVENGISYRESTAALRILVGLGFPWNLFRVFLLVPAVLRDPFYRMISVNRYRWFGRSNSCFMPDPDFSDRFK
jgi:predicted DCC family thiol-disulfide oxidoreductase YuxK